MGNKVDLKAVLTTSNGVSRLFTLFGCARFHCRRSICGSGGADNFDASCSVLRNLVTVFSKSNCIEIEKGLTTGMRWGFVKQAPRWLFLTRQRAE